jgi:hypothetical protein
MLLARLLRKHGFYFLICPSIIRQEGFEAKGFRKVLYSSVLATDMSLHFAWIARLKDFGASLRTEKEPSDEDDRVMLCQAIIKCADISNPVCSPIFREGGANVRHARLMFLNIGVVYYLRSGRNRLLWSRIWTCRYR